MNILVAVDLSDASQKVLEGAKFLSAALSSKVWLLHVADPDPDFVGYEPGPQTVRNAVAKEFHDEHCRLQKEAEKFRSVGIATTALLVQGPIVETILGETKKLEIDMVVVGSHGHGSIYQLVVGSVSEGVLQKSQCPVHVIPTRIVS